MLTIPDQLSDLINAALESAMGILTSPKALLNERHWARELCLVHTDPILTFQQWSSPCTLGQAFTGVCITKKTVLDRKDHSVDIIHYRDLTCNNLKIEREYWSLTTAPHVAINKKIYSDHDEILSLFKGLKTSHAYPNGSHFKLN